MKIKFSWEILLIILILIVFITSSLVSPYFLDVVNLLDTTTNFMEKGIIALAMTYIIISGNIDISVASNMGMASAFMGVFYRMGINIWLSSFFALVIATLGGFFNGYLITRFKLPAIAVTLGTYGLYRGIAYVLLKDTAVGINEESFLYIGQGYIGNTPIPFSLVLFLILALIFGIILHKTNFGRYIYAMGNNEQTCRFSGIPVDRIKKILFTISGFMSGLSAILLSSRLSSIRPDIGVGLELEVIATVVLGGVSILGGTGNMIGVILALFLVGYATFSMNLVNIPSQVITIIMGLLLITTVLLTQIFQFRERKT
ncbi:MAG: branched-chain amino acid ABC transporter permease [Dictyoglomus sp. NZ13-RE01]|nr:MAG: branched-chain amino acid ABC transporter permease [Dictyoglomus sp. NZ13-RE01]